MGRWRTPLVCLPHSLIEPLDVLRIRARLPTPPTKPLGRKSGISFSRRTPCMFSHRFWPAAGADPGIMARGAWGGPVRKNPRRTNSSPSRPTRRPLRDAPSSSLWIIARVLRLLRESQAFLLWFVLPCSRFNSRKPNARGMGNFFEGDDLSMLTDEPIKHKRRRTTFKDREKGRERETKDKNKQQSPPQVR